MAEPIDQLGLDIKPFKKAVQEANQANNSLEASTDKVNASISRTEKTASGGKFFQIAAVAGLLYKLGDAITGLGDRTAKAINDFQAGGSRRDANSGNRSDAALSAGVKPIIEDATAGFASKVSSYALQGLAAIAQGLNKVFKIDALDDFVQGVESVREEGEKELKLREDIAFQEDKAAKLAEKQNVTLESRLGILEAELVVEKKKLDLANLTTIEGRIQANQAKVSMGQLNMQRTELLHAQERINAAAKVDTAAMSLKQDGMKTVADYVKIEADYTAKIVEARRQGNTELANELSMQKQMALDQAKVDEHNLTPRQALGDRAAARKFDRDLKHEQARERDMQDRIRRGAHGATPGSQLARFQRREREQRALGGVGIKDMKVDQMHVVNMKVNIPR